MLEVNKEELESLIMVMVNDLKNRYTLESEALLGLYGNVQVQLVVTRDEAEMLDDENNLGVVTWKK